MTNPGPFVTTTDSARASRRGIDTGNVPMADFDQPEDGVQVKALSGYEFAPSNKELPRVTDRGLVLSREDAEQVIAEANGLVVAVSDGTNEAAEDSDDEIADPLDSGLDDPEGDEV